MHLALYHELAPTGLGIQHHDSLTCSAEGPSLACRTAISDSACC